MSERDTTYQIGDEVTVFDDENFAGTRGVLLEALAGDYWRVWMFAEGSLRRPEDYSLPEHFLARVGGRLQVGDRVVGLTGVHKDVEGTVVDTYPDGSLHVHLYSLDWAVRVPLNDLSRLRPRRQDVPT